MNVGTPSKLCLGGIESQLLTTKVWVPRPSSARAGLNAANLHDHWLDRLHGHGPTESRVQPRRSPPQLEVTNCAFKFLVQRSQTSEEAAAFRLLKIAAQDNPVSCICSLGQSSGVVSEGSAFAFTSIHTPQNTSFTRLADSLCLPKIFTDRHCSKPKGRPSNV
jgi:hypothetical protein